MECKHFDDLAPVELSSTRGCEECLKMGSYWVHLRECLNCGHVGCCDSSPNKHATKHNHVTKHPVIRSIQPGETWGYCYADDVMVELGE
jgi:uncharacterized UBP type Zn finger protein